VKNKLEVIIENERSREIKFLIDFLMDFPMDFLMDFLMELEEVVRMKEKG
jgi:hypothetical protein